MSDKPLTPIEIGLTAAIVAIEDNQPLILTASGSDGHQFAGLPFGPFDAVSHRTFEIGLRAWVEEQTGLRLGYVEQLYTFGDRGRHTQPGDTDVHVASIGYLALTRAADNNGARAPGANFEPWYRFFPWDLDLARIADQVDASPYHLCRVFREFTGFAVHQYLRQLRIRHGLESVLETADPLGRIAVDLGFTHHSHFTNAFRRDFEITPSVLRSSRFRY